MESLNDVNITSLSTKGSDVDVQLIIERESPKYKHDDPAEMYEHVDHCIALYEKERDKTNIGTKRRLNLDELHPVPVHEDIDLSKEDYDSFRNTLMKKKDASTPIEEEPCKNTHDTNCQCSCKRAKTKDAACQVSIGFAWNYISDTYFTMKCYKIEEIKKEEWHL